jgi:myo-inositol-1(or 4)-monophosphatase
MIENRPPAAGAAERDEVRSALVAVRDHVAGSLPAIEAERYSVSFKADGSPVTKADVALEAAITEILAERLPGLTMVGEESSPHAATTSDGFLAVLDPIDGTENFCSGLKEWGVSLGIWAAGRHVGSLLMLPELGESLMTGDQITPVRSRITGFSSSFCPEIATGIAEAGEYRVTGCAVYNIFNVIRGSFARFVNPKGAYVWDLLPGLMLALEHGCDVRLDEETYDGKLLSSDRTYRVDIRHRHDHHPR